MWKNLIPNLSEILVGGCVLIACHNGGEVPSEQLAQRAQAIVQRLEASSATSAEGASEERQEPWRFPRETPEVMAEAEIFAKLWLCSDIARREEMMQARVRKDPGGVPGEILKWNYYLHQGDFSAALKVVERLVSRVEHARATADERWLAGLSLEILLFCNSIVEFREAYHEYEKKLRNLFPAAEINAPDSPYTVGWFRGETLLSLLTARGEFGLTGEERARADALGLIEKEPEPFTLSPDEVTLILQKGPNAAITDLEDLWNAGEHEALVVIADARLQRNPDDLPALYIRLAVATVKIDVPAFREHGEHLVRLLHIVTRLNEAALWRSFFHGFDYVQEDEPLAIMMRRGMRFKRDFREKLEELERAQEKLAASGKRGQGKGDSREW